MVGQVELQRDERGIATVWLDNPGRLNALSDAMVVGLADALTELAGEADCRAVILRGRSGVFCAGRDLKDLKALQSADDAAVVAMYRHMQRMNEAVYYAPMPTIGVVERYALGIGTMIATWTDITLAEETALFGYPEVHHGITPYGAVPTLLNTMSQKALFDLLLTGRRVDAGEAQTLGIVTRAVPADHLDAEVAATLAALGKGNPVAIRKSKQFIREREGSAYRDGLTVATEKAIQGIRSPELREGLAAFAGRKPPART